MRQIKKSKGPVVLAVNGKAGVVQDAEASQRLPNVAAGIDARDGIGQGMEDATKGRIRPVKEFFEEFEAKYGLPR